MDNPADNQALASELKLSLFKINKKDETKKVVSLVIRHRKKGGKWIFSSFTKFDQMSRVGSKDRYTWWQSKCWNKLRIVYLSM